MASEVDICNLALSHLGDDATVTNLAPPEGSAQAEHCARFYPIARDSLLEQHDWNFNTGRGTLAALVLDTSVTEWAYAYALPNNTLKVISVMPSNATGDYNQAPDYGYGTDFTSQTYIPPQTKYVTQPFEVETNSTGNLILLTNVQDAFVRYTKRVTDTTKFSPLFVDVLSWYLAAYLAGPIIKGDVGRAEAKGNMQIAMAMLGKATTSDANQRFTDVSTTTTWIANR